jgi:hypothetical protein
MKAKEQRVCQPEDAEETPKEPLGSGLASAIEINGPKLREHFGEFVRDTVEQTLNALSRPKVCNSLVLETGHRNVGRAMCAPTVLDLSELGCGSTSASPSPDG